MKQSVTMNRLCQHTVHCTVRRHLRSCHITHGLPTGDASEHGKLSKREKKRLKQQHEAAIRQAELARLAGDAAPSTAAEFERLVVGSPNSSFVWIKYMAFLISLGETDKARAGGWECS